MAFVPNHVGDAKIGNRPTRTIRRLSSFSLFTNCRSQIVWTMSKLIWMCLAPLVVIVCSEGGYQGGQRLLFRVLRALALYFTTVGYVQGMAAVVATLLCYYDEEQAFVMAVRLWQLRGVGYLYGGDGDDFSGLMGVLQEFEGWLKDSNPKVTKQLQELGIGPTSFGTKWVSYAVQLQRAPFKHSCGYGTYSYYLAIPTPKLHGQARARRSRILACCMRLPQALMHGMQDALLGADFENAMKNVTGTMQVRDDEVLMRVARGRVVTT